MRKVAFLFPGQGSQYAGMGRSLCNQYAIARQTFAEANEALGFDLAGLCFDGPAGELQKTEFTQPAILTHSVAAYRVFMHEIGLRAHFMAGHSLGEIAALTCAGAIPFADAVRIVNKRGRFMQSAVALGAGAMSAVSDLDSLAVERVCQEISTDGELVVVSNYNAPKQTVISGHTGALERAEARLKELGGGVIRLKVSAPFHSPLMKQAASDLEEELLACRYSDLNVPVIANINALPYAGVAKIVQNLTVQMTQPIQWNATMQFLKFQEVNVAVELGPGTVLRNMFSRTIPEVHSFAFDKEQDLAGLRELIESRQLLYPCFISRCLAIAVCTRNRNWDQVAYQHGVVDPYRRIQSMSQELEQNSLTPTLDQKRAALEMLRSVFATKQTPLEEQEERFRQLMEETDCRDLFPELEAATQTATL